MKYVKRGAHPPKTGDVFRRTVYQTTSSPPYIRVRVDNLGVLKGGEVVVEYKSGSIVVTRMPDENG